MKDLEWEIGVLINSYADRVKGIEHDRDEIESTYVKAILLNVEKYGYGLVLPIDDFVECVRSGGITDYDGCGDLLDENGEEIDSVCCDTDFLQEAKLNKNARYVAWFNK